MPITDARLAFVRALRAWRKVDRLTQERAADLLGISRKTYGEMERGRWEFAPRERMHMAQTFRAKNDAVGAAYAAMHGIALADDDAAPAEVYKAPSVALDPIYARAVVDSALYTVAETFDVPPKMLRKLAAALLARFAAVELTMPQAAAVVAAAEAEMKGAAT
jgi:DNA-binding XRE family transcriptional regulator